MSGVRPLLRPLDLQHIEDEGAWLLTEEETVGADDE